MLSKFNRALEVPVCRVALTLLLPLILASCSRVPLLAPRPMDSSWAPYDTKPALTYYQTETRSFYITMHDGVKIAVDLHLPEKLAEGEKLPTILHLTRYFRAYDVVPPLRWRFKQPNERVRRFLANGYAWLDVDVRGSGASFGSQFAPWAPEEVSDYTEIVDWILKQPWSDGQVGAWGSAYDGAAALMLLSRSHPAVKAVAPEFSLFDLYLDVAYPGGAHLSSFTEKWGELNQALDRNDVDAAIPSRIGRMALRGVKPVDNDGKRRELAAAVEQHRYNWDPYATALRAQFRDDLWYSNPALHLETFSPHGHLATMDAAGAPVYLHAGWFDGAYQRGAIHAFMTLKNPENRLVLGPWNHGGTIDASPDSSRPSRFDRVDDQMRFFDVYLKASENGLKAEPRVHYYTMGEGRWKSSDTWPPLFEPLRLYLAPGGTLSRRVPEGGEHFDDTTVDPTAGTGRLSRWHSLLGSYPVEYADRDERDQLLLTYTSEALDKDVEVTGHPVVTLHVASDRTDGVFFVYLEDVDPAGAVSLITEGQLRALHRKLSDEAPPYVSPTPYHTYLRKDAAPLEPGQPTELIFDLLPTSYLFRKGHQIRIAIAGADRDHFEITPGPPPHLRVFRESGLASHIVLPTIPR